MALSADGRRALRRLPPGRRRGGDRPPGGAQGRGRRPPAPAEHGVLVAGPLRGLPPAPGRPVPPDLGPPRRRRLRAGGARAVRTAIVGGALANKPGNGGNAWTRLQWLLGLRRLGFRPYLIEQI